MYPTEDISSATQSVHDLMQELGHEQVLFCNDPQTGLMAIIALHSTTLGPGMGGTRWWNYASHQEAVVDALRLSRGMTYKNAVAGLDAGGGKAVIIGTGVQKSEALVRRFGQFIDTLGGLYVTAEDVGMTTADMELIALETNSVAGLPESKGGGGDPSPVTAYGVYMGMKAAAKSAYGSDELSGKTIWVQGVGNVGSHLVELLHKEGANIKISDLNEDRLVQISGRLPVEVISGDQMDLEMDIYAPCALGATLNDESIPGLKCQVVAGGANNQLQDEIKHADMLKQRGIIYAPDFLINSGGIINVYSEYQGDYQRDKAYQKTEKIYDTCWELIQRAHSEGITTHQAAVKIAEDRILAKRNN
jgi:leucine dehydrogenase